MSRSIVQTDQSEDSDKTLDLSERDAGSDTDEFSNNTTTNATSETPCEDEFATPEPRPLMALATPKGADPLSWFTAANRPPSHSSFKTPGASSSTHNPAEVVKKPRVSGVVSSATPNPRARKNYRRPLNENDDESFRRNARLSFSSAVGDDATPVRVCCCFLLVNYYYQ